jgi:hypothetical protein
MKNVDARLGEPTRDREADSLRSARDENRHRRLAPCRQPLNRPRDRLLRPFFPTSLYDKHRYRASSLILLRGTVASQSGRLRAAVSLTLPDERERRSPIVLDARPIVIQSCNTKLKMGGII